MVAIINTSSNVKNVVQYNENKLKQDVAQLIHSVNYGKDTKQLAFTDKIRTLENLISLNERTKLNAVHISLNFDPSEKLSMDNLSKIAESYMGQIGFGSQPYLVYQHYDAGHPHIHIVSTNIQRDGKRIKMQNIGRNQSEKARKQIEQEFNLVKAQDHHLKQTYEVRPIRVQKVQYGKSDTRRAITNVLNAILPTYKYGSLHELNAVLKHYNILADRGNKGSRLYDSGGLLYRVLNNRGEKVGIPIKASQIHTKPTLSFLANKFRQNKENREPNKKRIKNAVDLSFVRKPNQSLQDFIAVLQKEKIQLVIRQNEKGIIYGLTYVDHYTKCVFNGSDLGKPYSANQIQQRCTRLEPKQDKEGLRPQQSQGLKNQPRQFSPNQHSKEESPMRFSVNTDIIGEFSIVENGSSLAAELKNDYRRKRKKRLRN